MGELHDYTDCIRKCQKGNRKAFHQLYNHSFKQLLKLASRYSTDSSAAKDVLHGAYLKIFESIKAYSGDSTLLIAWMSRIVINEALQLKRKSKRMKYLENLELYAQSVSSRAESNLAFEEVMVTVEEMPVDLKTIFMLREIDNYSHKEISELLEITESHSRTRLTRAKVYLRKTLGDIKLYVA